MDVAGEYIPLATRRGLMSEDKRGLKQRICVPLQKPVPPGRRTLTAIMIARDDFDRQLGVCSPPDYERIQETISGASRGVNEIAEYHQPLARMGLYQRRETIQVQMSRTTWKRDTRATKDIVLAEVRVRDQRRAMCRPDECPVRMQQQTLAAQLDGQRAVG
jgi:hypothetical protein